MLTCGPRLAVIERGRRGWWVARVSGPSWAMLEIGPWRKKRGGKEKWAGETLGQAT
jgi:hypothetical protein